jgi:hypothetical protein
MAAPTAVAVSVDATEYSQYEEESATITITVDVTGSSMTGEQVRITLRKARRARDVSVATLTHTLGSETSFTKTIHLPDVVTTDEISKVRRGRYFVRAESVTSPSVYGVTSDFTVAIVTTSRLRQQELFGVELTDITSLGVKDQPSVLTGLEVVEVSANHPAQWGTLAYTGPAGETELSGSVDTGSTTTIVTWVGGGLTTNAHIGQYLVAGGETRPIVSNTSTALTVSPGFSSAPAASSSALIQKSGQRTLSWCGGPVVALASSKTRYLLRRVARPTDTSFIVVDVTHDSLPYQTNSEDLLITAVPMTTTRLANIIERATAWAEESGIQVYLEPTRIITDIPSDAATTQSGSDIPVFAGADWDEVVPPLTYFRPSHGYVAFTCPQQPIISFASLSGRIGTSEVIDVPSDWIQFAPSNGFVELVPYGLNSVSQFQGMVWYTFVRPDVIPNFWHYDMLAGFRKRCPAPLVELVHKKAALDLYTMLSQARNAVSGEQIGRDGVLERTEYTTSAMYGTLSASILDIDRWLKHAVTELRMKYRGAVVDALGGP